MRSEYMTNDESVDDQVRQASAEASVQSSETIENLRIEVEQLKAEVEKRERQMALAARYIARFYEADRNDYAKKSDVDDARQMVFAIGADLKRILEESAAAKE